jgi:hypothetical protein
MDSFGKAFSSTSTVIFPQLQAPPIARVDVLAIASKLEINWRYRDKGWQSLYVVAIAWTDLIFIRRKEEELPGYRRRKG